MYMTRIIYNRFIPWKNFAAINLLGIIFIKRGVQATPRLLNHEKIHSAQQRELGYLFFFVCYLAEYLWHLTLGRNAYRCISFEREAYDHEKDLEYLKHRQRFAMWRK